MRKIKIIAIFAITLLPLLASAQILQPGGSFADFISRVLRIIYMLMQSLFAVIGLYIIFITWKYINALREGDAKAAEYRNRLIGAIIGFAVSFSLWSIIGLFSNTLGWTKTGIPMFTAPTSN